jgi:N-acetyl sugar amidotransferase
MQLDEEGVCPVCRYEEFKQNETVDWQARRRELDEICVWGKTNTRSTYDCIVTVSGGKDSTRQACYARDDLGMNPLLVSCSYPPEQMTDLGAHNIANLISLGFDTLSIGLNPQLWKRLMREGLRRYGNWAKSTEMALYAIPIHAAIAYQIPLIFYGENPAFTIGEKHGRLDGDASRLKLGNTIAGGPRTILPSDVTDQDAHFYYYPSDDDMEAGHLRMVYLGYYMQDWSGRNNAEFSIERGLKIRSEPPEMTGDLWGFSCLDEDYSIVNQYLKFVKLGFGRVTDQVCEAISAGAMTRAEGMALVKQYDGKCDPSFTQRFCEYLEISEAEFNELVDRYRNRTLWRLDATGHWRLDSELDRD